MTWILALLLVASPDGGVSLHKPKRPLPTGQLSVPASDVETAELRVFRTRAELPETVARTLPADFDWEHFQVAVNPRELGTKGPFRLVEVTARNDSRGLVVDYPEPPPRCECSGVYRREDPRLVSAPGFYAYKLPRAEKRVFLETRLIVCPPCLAP